MTKDEAISIVETLLNEGNQSGSSDLTVDTDYMKETETHWIVPYDSKRYLDTGDTSYAMIGNNPFTISKETGLQDNNFNLDNYYPDLEL